MSGWFVLMAAVLLIQFPPSSLRETLRPAQGVSASDVATVPAWLPVRIPAALYEKWRKYGIWDYKQQSSQYRDFTQFNFGATGNAAGLDKNSLLALSQASKPTRDDVNRLDNRGLLANFDHNFDEFQELLSMADQDSHLIRIADDFTWLDSSSKWPRTDIGLSPKRWNEYRSLFEKLSLPEGIVRTADFPGAVFFIARVRGLCTGGSSAGYVYSTGTFASTTESPSKALDAKARQNPKQHYAYVFKSLKPNWYAFYEIDW